MARVQQLVCDRCDRNIKDDSDTARRRLSRYDHDYHGTRIDLCELCSDQFKSWLARTELLGYPLTPKVEH